MRAITGPRAVHYVEIFIALQRVSVRIKSEREGKFSRRAHAKNTSRSPPRIILSRGGIIEFARRQDVFQVIARITLRLRENRERALGEYEKPTGPSCLFFSRKHVQSPWVTHARACASKNTSVTARKIVTTLYQVIKSH